MKKSCYFDRMKPSCPSGYVPPAPLAFPRAETPSSSSLSHPSGGQESKKGVRDAPGIVSRGLPPLPLDLGPARGVGVFLDYCLLHASTLLLRCLLRELAKGKLLDRSGLFLCPLRSSVVFHHSSPHARRRGEL